MKKTFTIHNIGLPYTLKVIEHKAPISDQEWLAADSKELNQFFYTTIPTNILAETLAQTDWRFFTSKEKRKIIDAILNSSLT